MITFSNPAMLWSLLGISIPIAIHLLSRKDGKVIPLGSIRYLEESPSQQFKGIKLNEYWLLFLRSLLIIILSFLLAGANYVSNKNETKKWLVLEQSVIDSELVKSLVDSLSVDGYEIRLLAKDFPLAGTNQQIIESDYYTLLETLAQHDLTKGIVISHNKASAFQGEILPLPKNVEWLSINHDPNQYLLKVSTINRDSLQLRYGYTEANHTYFTDKVIPKHLYNDSLAVSYPDTITIGIYNTQNFIYDRQMIEAALTVIQQKLDVIIKTQPIDDPSALMKTDWLFWLSDEQVPVHTGKAIVYQKAETTKLIDQVKSNWWILTQRLDQEVATQKHLTATLAKLLINTDSLTARALSYDRSFLADSLAFSLPQENHAAMIYAKGSSKLLDFLLLILFLSVLLTERFTAYLRKQ
jgi:Aerotolerance regulator N-terminal